MDCEFHDLDSGRKLSQTLEMSASRKENKGNSDEVDDIEKFIID